MDHPGDFDTETPAAEPTLADVMAAITELRAEVSVIGANVVQVLAIAGATAEGAAEVGKLIESFTQGPQGKILGKFLGLPEGN